MTVGEMLLLSKVSLRRPPVKSGLGHQGTVGQSDSSCAASRWELRSTSDVLPCDHLVTLMEGVHDDDADQ